MFRHFTLLLLILAMSPSAFADDAPAWSRATVPLGGDYWKGTEAPPIAGARPPVWGFADLHAHFTTYLAYGGRVVHGKPFAPGGMAEALDDCGVDHGHGFGGRSFGFSPEGSHRTAGWPGFEGWPKYNSLVHQQAYVDWIRRAWQGGLRVVQMDVQNTAFLGQANAIVNRLFIRGNLMPLPHDDVSAVRLQVDGARALFEGPASDFAAIARSPEEARTIIESGKLAVILGIEVEAIGGLLHPEQLRADPRPEIVAVLDQLWNAGIRHVIPIHLTRNAFGHPAVFQRTLNASNYAETGQWYDIGEAYDLGIRFDPRRAKRDPISWFFELVGWVRGRIGLPHVLAGAARSGLTPAGDILIEEMMKKGFLIDVEHMSELASQRTLELAEREDVPIMASHGSFRDLAFGNRLTYRPDGSYEATALDLPFSEAKHGEYGTSDTGKTRTERAHSPELMQRIRKLGGMIGIGISSGGLGVSWRDRIPLDCDGTAKSFLQGLLYANERMGNQGVTIGSDVSGFSDLPSPRFGTDACPAVRGDAVRSAGGRRRAQALAQRFGVRYSTPVASVGAWRFESKGKGDDVAYSPAEVKAWEAEARAKASGQAVSPSTPEEKRVAQVWEAMEEGSAPPLERSRAGTREWDVNLDGVAHYGLLPDFLQDAANVLRANGAGGELASVFHSAEYYLQMWEKIDARAAAIRARELR